MNTAKMKSIKVAALTATLLLSAGCQVYEFSLPEGDAKTGAALFTSFQCITCHSVEGVEDDGIERTINVKLGGEKSRIYTYEELLTSIINPSHKLAKGYNKKEISIGGKSKMRNYNDVMSVSELIDIVTYLETKYSLKPIGRTHYPDYR